MTKSGMGIVTALVYLIVGAPIHAQQKPNIILIVVLLRTTKLSGARQISSSAQPSPASP